MEDVIFAQEQATQNRCILKMTQQGQHGFDTVGNHQTGPPGRRQRRIAQSGGV